jgi:hypothetical protein
MSLVGNPGALFLSLAVSHLLLLSSYSAAIIQLSGALALRVTFMYSHRQICIVTDKAFALRYTAAADLTRQCETPK